VNNSKLFITPNLVYPAFDGGRKLTLGRIMDAVENSMKVTLIAFNYQFEMPGKAKAFFERSGVEFICFNPLNARNNRVMDYALSMGSFKSVYAQRIDRELDFFELLHAHLNQYGYGTVSVESIILDGAFTILDKFEFERIELVFHNVESDFLKSLSASSKSLSVKFAYWLESKKIARLERALDTRQREMMGRYCLVFLTQYDYEIYTKKGLFENAPYEINVNNVYVPHKINRNVDIATPFFLFPGSLDFTFNRDGILWLLQNYEKDVTCNIKIYVTGAVSDENAFIFRRYRKIEVLGFVSENELMELYSKCIAVVSPIISGSGIKMKNLEAIAYKIPLIMTKFSAVGVQTESCNTWVSDNNQVDFISKMTKVLGMHLEGVECCDC